MGLFDRLKSIVASAASVDMRGPLQLSPGDGVTYYREKLAVTGVRRLDAQGSVCWQYCLRGADGARAVLVAEEGPDAACAMQRVVDAGLPWDKDVIDGVGEEPFRLAGRGQASVVTAGDVGGPPARSVSFRIFRDESGDRVVVLEDWGGRRESRIGDPVYETELEFTRTEADAEAAAEAAWYDARAEADVQRGSAGAAAKLLDGSRDDAREVADVIPADDRDPTAYSDEAWDDEAAAPAAPPTTSGILTVFDSEEDEWRAAAAYLREHGIPAEKA